jgi:hypothetical protein
VINVNEPPFNMNMSSTGTSAEQFEIDTPVISENLQALTYIGQIVVLDPDKSDSLKIKSVTSDVVVRNVHCIPVSKVIFLLLVLLKVIYRETDFMHDFIDTGE